MRFMDWLITPYRKKGTFYGGLHVPSHKSMSTQKPATAPPLPPYLYISLRQIDGNMQIPKVRIGDRVLGGQLISEPCNPDSVPRHAPTSGTITAIEQRADVHPSNLKALHIVIETDGLDETQEALPNLAYQHLDAAMLLARIQQCGIAGMGGAGFPTARKLGHLANTLIVNAAECEPYITCDDMQMREQSSEILQGAQIAAHILKAKQIIIGIEDDKPIAIAAMNKAAKQLNDSRIRIQSVPTKYPSGNQRQLFELLLGVRIPNHHHATDYGLICHNSATIKSIYDAIIKGKPLIERYVSVTGEGICQPQVFKARLGTPIDYLVQQAGGESQPSRWIIGGPMMGYELTKHYAGIKKTTNCVLLLPKQPSADKQENACIRCAKCASACPMELLPQQLYWYSRNQQHERLNQYRLFDCIECGICASVCPSYIPLVQYFRYSKGNIREEKRKATAANIARARHEAREARLAREAAERKARMDAKREQLSGKRQPSPNISISSSGHEAKQSAIEAAKARAATKRQARLQSLAPTSDTDVSNQNANAKLAAAKAKAQAQKQVRLAKQTTHNTPHIKPISTDKDAIEEAERKNQQVANMAKAQVKQKDTALNHSEKTTKLTKNHTQHPPNENNS